MFVTDGDYSSSKLAFLSLVLRLLSVAGMPPFTAPITRMPSSAVVDIVLLVVILVLVVVLIGVTILISVLNGVGVATSCFPLLSPALSVIIIIISCKELMLILSPAMCFCRWLDLPLPKLLCVCPLESPKYGDRNEAEDQKTTNCHP